MKIEQKMLHYTLADSTSQGSDGSGHDAALPFYDQFHLVRDWSALNRRGLNQVGTGGSPHVFGVNVKATGSIIDKSAVDDTTVDEHLSDDAVAASAMVTIRFYAPQNTWVMKQAAKKVHRAREAMFKASGVKQKDRGAYSRFIRYCLESPTETYISPVTTTARSSIAGGTWDHTQIIFPDDSTGAYIALTGLHADEESNTSYTTVQLTQMYLASRGTIDSDTNRETSVTPAAESILAKMLKPNYSATADAIAVNARGEQDNPPYDLTVRGGDHSDLVEVGRIQFNPYTAGTGSCYIEVPFGIVKTQTQILDHSDSDADISLDLSFEAKAIATM